VITAVLGRQTNAQAAYGTRTPYCATHFKQARAVLSGSISGIDAAALELGCSYRSPEGSRYIRWASTPHPSFIAHSSLGSLQSVKVTFGPVVTRVVWQRMTPWQFPTITSPAYITWALLHPKVNNKPVMVVHSYSARICTVSIKGTRVCSDMDLKTQYRIGYGLRVCMVAPGPKCGGWKAMS
jgi:hypothetical protein